MSIAKTILEQFGGGRSVMMIGAKNLVDHGNALSMRHMKTTIDGEPANYFKITLNSMDLYDLEFGWIRGNKYVVRKTVENVFCEDLREIFQDTTKLYLTL